MVHFLLFYLETKFLKYSSSGVGDISKIQPKKLSYFYTLF